MCVSAPGPEIEELKRGMRAYAARIITAILPRCPRRLLRLLSNKAASSDGDKVGSGLGVWYVM
jgi:hypothetical protein